MILHRFCELAVRLPLLGALFVFLAIVIGLYGQGVRAADKSFSQDRAAILAMAGDFKVTFSFRETVALAEDYTLTEPYRSGGMEIVRVIGDDDEGRRISLQHILVAEDDEGEKHVVKHWRQDWTYEPRAVIAYRGDNAWAAQSLKRKERTGAWLQAVYHVDDSPRYASIGRWSHKDGISSWQSTETWRPLPRREHSKRDDYDVLVGFNRHTITPNGWVHEQDNAKLFIRDGKRGLIAREIGVNSYTRNDEFDIALAENYWTKTKDFWKAVRAHWQDIENSSRNVVIRSAEDRDPLWKEVMSLADQVASAEMSTEAAIGQLEAVLGRHIETASAN